MAVDEKLCHFPAWLAAIEFRGKSNQPTAFCALLMRLGLTLNARGLF